MQKWYPVFVLLLGSMLIGCLGDDVFEEVKPRVILQPATLKFKAEGTNDLVAQWSPSLTDTQMNFKGYYIELYTSTKDSNSTVEIDEILDTIGRAHAPKSDTSYVFKNIAPGRYTLQVWGERYPDPANPDSLVLSKFAAIYSFTFDPTPVLPPTELLAHSNGPGSVTLYWEASPSATQPGMVAYIVGYREDKASSSALTYRVRAGGPGIGPTTYSISLPSTSEALELPYMIWVKGIRNDSTESVDSAVIIWSGAKAVGVTYSAVEIGKKFFIGLINGIYDIKQSDDPAAQIGVTAVDSTITIQALDGARFINRIDTAIIDQLYFKAPFPDTDYTESSLTLPRNPESDVWFYVLFKDKARARVVFLKNANGTLIHENNSIKTAAKYQPGGPPYFLTYF